MKVYGQLDVAQLEQLSSAPTAIRGRIYFDTTLVRARYYDGSAWVDFTGGQTVTGTRAAPQAIVAGTGIAITGQLDQVWFIKGTGGVTISANPAIAAGERVGQMLTLIGRSNSDTVRLNDALGTSLKGDWLGEADSIIRLMWDGTNWVELCRNF